MIDYLLNNWKVSGLLAALALGFSFFAAFMPGETWSAIWMVSLVPNMLFSAIFGAALARVI